MTIDALDGPQSATDGFPVAGDPAAEAPTGEFERQIAGLQAAQRQLLGKLAEVYQLFGQMDIERVEESRGTLEKLSELVESIGSTEMVGFRKRLRDAAKAATNEAENGRLARVIQDTKGEPGVAMFPEAVQETLIRIAGRILGEGNR